MRIRIAQRLVKDGATLNELDDEATGLFVPWIEIDGHRITALRDVEISMGAKATSVRVDFIAAAEIVFVDDEGVPLERVALEPETGARRAAAATILYADPEVHD